MTPHDWFVYGIFVAAIRNRPMESPKLFEFWIDYRALAIAVGLHRYGAWRIWAQLGPFCFAIDFSALGKE